MGYDDVIGSNEEFGKYQRYIFILLCLSSIVCAIHAFAGVFLLAQPDFRCLLPSETQNTTFALLPEVWESSYPNNSRSPLGHHACEFFVDKNTSAKCNKYVYDTSIYPNSAVTEWDLVCDRSWMVATNHSLLMVGVLLGSIVFGQLSDRYGRKPILMIAFVIQAISCTWAGLASNYISFTIARILIGSTITGVFIIIYVLGMEMLGPRQRLYGSVALMTSYSLGEVSTSIFAYFIRDWRWLQLAMSLPGLLFLSYYWLISESTRWLLSSNRKDEAIANIKRQARINKVTIPEDVLETLLADLNENKPSIVTSKGAASKDVEQPTLLDLLKYPNMRRKSLLIFFDWFVITATFYGLSWNTDQLGDNPLVNFLICALVELPAHSSLLFVLNRYGRRPVLCGNMFLSGIGLMLTIVVPNSKNWLIITLATMAKFGITAAFNVIYIFTTEQFPTVVRNVGLGAASMTARFGGILAPFVFMLSQIWRPMPLVICGALAFAGGSLTLLLPETLNRPTLETLEDGENFTRKKCRSMVVGTELENMKAQIS